MAELDYTLYAVSKENKEPVTRQIVNLVTRNIEMQILSPGDRLPTERELAERLGVARGTVKTAYRKLELQNVIRTRQGSGSFVIRDEELSQKLRKEKAVLLLSRTIASLGELGLGTAEISHLFDACISQRPDRSVSIALVSDSAELLLDLSRQLSYLPGVSISIYILESVTENRDPETFLRGFDLVLAPSQNYPALAKRLPGLTGKVVEAAVAPTSDTLVSLTALPRKSRIGIICRTNVFLANVKELLLQHGFQPENILSFFEMDYTTKTYFPGGIDALISFGDAHIFTDGRFAFRNEEFWSKGGKIIAFKHQLERGTLIMIEDQVRRIHSGTTPFIGVP